MENAVYSLYLYRWCEGRDAEDYPGGEEWSKVTKEKHLFSDP